MRLTEEERALLQRLRKNGTSKEELKQLTSIAKMIISGRKKST